jgi:hypothetical protein
LADFERSDLACAILVRCEADQVAGVIWVQIVRYLSVWKPKDLAISNHAPAGHPFGDTKAKASDVGICGTSDCARSRILVGIESENTSRIAHVVAS